MSVLAARGIGKAFHRNGTGAVTVLDGFDLALEPGELVVVTGPSLAGKTTLVDLLAGWARPDHGQVVWDGGSTEAPPWSYLSVVPQAFALLEELTVAENIGMAARFARRAPGGQPDHTDQLLERLGIDRLRDRGAFEISVGERQRTMVARALADRPKVILADEPVAHQDQRHAQVVLDLLREAVDAGAACLVATRSPDLATEPWADRVVTLGSSPGVQGVS